MTKPTNNPEATPVNEKLTAPLQAPRAHTAPAPASQKMPLKSKLWLGASILVLLIPLGVWIASLSQISSAKLGDCLIQKNGNNDAKTEYTKASCQDKKAEFKVYSVGKMGSDEAKCVNVAGANYSYSIQNSSRRNHSTDVYCIGPKDADLSKSLNVAKPGDCVNTASGVDSATKVACTEPGARPILSIQNNVMKNDYMITEACKKASPDTVYHLGLTIPTGTSSALRSIEGWQKVFCLGESKA